jgi:tetratricopeptide (TPR) repeat protein
VPYPYNLREPASVAEAREFLLSYPARSFPHLFLARFFKERDLLFQGLQELQIALWLDPLNPYARDQYAQALLWHGREREGFAEVSRSVFFSPSLSAHAYLRPRFIPWLSVREQKAIEEGLQRAMASGFAGAANGLGTFYNALGRFAAEGEVYQRAALATPEARVPYLLRAAQAYVRADKRGQAETLLRQAAAAVPQEAAPYHYLATWILAPQGNFAAAKLVIAEGIKKGADPFSLSLSLAEAAQQTGDPEEARIALLRAVALRPSSFDAHFRLGLLYLREGKADRAVLALRKAADLNPQSAEAFYQLGIAEERRYQFFAAEKAYGRAMALAPDNVGLREHYEAFLRKMTAQNANAEPS